MKCPECKKQFSNHLIQHICINGHYIKCCPICALSIRNESMGLPKGMLFQGEMANDMYEQALDEL